MGDQRSSAIDPKNRYLRVTRHKQKSDNELIGLLKRKDETIQKNTKCSKSS